MAWLVDYWPALIVAVIIAAGLLLIKLLSRPSGLPYQARGKLVTKSELNFYRTLRQVVPDDLLIFTMVRLADILVVPEEIPNRRVWLNRILAKHVDFVLCDSESLQPRLAIELDDASHQRADRQARDEFLNQAFAAARLPLLRFPVASSYDARAIKLQIEKSLRGKS